MNKRYLFLTLILLFLSIGAFQPFGCMTIISGTVTAPEGSPVRDAIVSINAEGIGYTTTDSSGTYSFTDVPYGQYTITITSTAYADKTSPIDTSYLETGITCKDITGANIQLEAITYSWLEMGTGSASAMGISNSGGNTIYTYCSLAMNNSGYPVVAWFDSNSGDNIYLKQWSGSSWGEIGGSATGGGISNTNSVGEGSSLAINNSGNPIIAWHDNSSGDYEIYLKQWNGTTWEELGGSATSGGISNNAGESSQPSLAINDSGNPVIAWNDGTSGDNEIYIRQYNGSSWEELGSSASGGGISDNSGDSALPSLAVNDSGNPVVAWEDIFSIYLKQWNGTSWEELGSSASGVGISSNSMNPSLSINGSGNPVVAWDSDSSGDAEI